MAASTLGFLSFSRFILSASSPLIAGYLYTLNIQYTFYYIAALFGVAVLILLFIRLPRVQPAEEHGHGHSHAEAGDGTHRH